MITLNEGTAKERKKPASRRRVLRIIVDDEDPPKVEPEAAPATWTFNGLEVEPQLVWTRLLRDCNSMSL